MISGASEARARWRTSDVDVDDVAIHVHRTGRSDRPALVLAHGLGDSGRCWWRVAQSLEDDFDIYLIDARNHGGSGTGGGGAAQLAADLAAVVTRLGLDRPTLMGHSIGARTVAEFAAAHPGGPERLVLIDPPWTANQESDGRVPDARREAVRRWLASFAGASATDLAAVARQQHPSWPAEEYPTWIESKQLVRPEAADTLAGDGWGETVVAIDCPTLLVSGDSGDDGGGGGDGIVTGAVARRIAELNSRVTSVHIAGAGHNIHREQFDRFIATTRDFLLEGRS